MRPELDDCSAALLRCRRCALTADGMLAARREGAGGEGHRLSSNRRVLYVVDWGVGAPSVSRQQQIGW